MFKTVLAAATAAFLLSLSALSAEATPVNLTFSGNLGAGAYDGSQQFGANSYGNIAGTPPYSITLTYDPASLTNDNCGAMSANNCQWSFGAGGITEAVTINGITHSYTATSGNIAFCACSGDQIDINASGSVGEFGGDFIDGTQLFSNQTNVNNVNLLNVFSNVALSSASFQSSTSAGGSLSFYTVPTTLSDAAAVPEPLTLSLFGAGLAGLAVIRRRKSAAAIA